MRNPEEIVNNGYYDAAVALMDDALREEIASKLAPCSEIEFLVAYMDAHKAKYGEDFEI